MNTFSRPTRTGQRVMLPGLGAALIAASMATFGAGCETTNPDGAGGSPVTCTVPADAKPTLTVKKIGTPAWEMVDYHRVSRDCGSAYSKFSEMTQKILPPPNHELNPVLGIGPGAAHAGPYDHEIGDSLAAQKVLDHLVFPINDGLLPNCIVATWMVVPSTDAPMGSSPDFTSGPIIPNTVFPIHGHFQAYFDDAILAPNVYDFDVVALDAKLNPPFSVDGHSHFPLFIVEDADSLPKSCGKTEYKSSLIDAAGNGWEFSFTFYIKE